ncbi:unnamed protein product [Arctia plantaginis]|uniref:Uncharacterized protein n=1 Tax=Arctia plantaginis TaxID=874455 RepID=A0A8S1BLE9_ARCPL|nr:unnamed protein product [Arctia plantaginis]CAB3260593.1 unnamed protein product [Arctia plantaginis]
MIVSTRVGFFYSKDPKQHNEAITGGCQNGSSAGKRRIAENIRTHITASFFVDEAKDTANLLDRNWLAVISIGGVLLLVAAMIIILKFKSRKYKYRTMYPRAAYSQLTTIDEDLIALTPSTTLKANTEQIPTKSELEEPT